MKQKIKMKKHSNGITLIALVITIIVLLILAGVTIATLTGDNGILTKATQASEKTRERNAYEQIEIAITGSIGTDGILNNTDLENNLNQIENITGVPSPIEDSDYPFVVKVGEEYNYLINKDGTIGDVIERKGIQIGDYVNYTPKTLTTEYKADKLTEVITGSTFNADSITQDEEMVWRILNIHANGTVDLIGEPTEQTVHFMGAKGYNNGVYVMNDICKTLYSNSNLGIDARNINIEDIEDHYNMAGKEAKETYKEHDNVQYGKIYTDTVYREYPMLYAQEVGSGIDIELEGKTEEEIEAQLKKDGIDQSNSYYTEPTTERSAKALNNLTIKQTYYTFNGAIEKYFKDYNENTKKSIVENILFETGKSYWLASRSVAYESYGSGCARFELYAADSTLKGRHMVYAYGYTDEEYSIRPIVSLGPDIEITPVDNPDGSSTANMHQISKK